LATVPRPVTIQYRRLPDRLRSFQGTLLEERWDHLVISQRIRLRNPRRKFGKVVVANGYQAVWFILRGKWCDIGKFYDRQGNFTGYYCDIIRPVASLLSNQSKTSIITDLFLDLWIDREGNCIVLDEDELNRAIAKHVISAALARQSRRELRKLIQLAKTGSFPARWIRTYRPATNSNRA